MQQEKKKIILASASPRRKALLKEAGFQIRVIPSYAVERNTAHRPSQLVMQNAAIKANDVAYGISEGLVLGSDTMIYFEGKTIGKPKSRKDAAEMLQKLSGKSHYVYTGVCLIDAAHQKEIRFYDRSEVTFLKLTKKQIQEYHQKIDPMDKAGAYAIQEHGDMIIKQIQGSYSNIMGLPIEKVKQIIKKC